MFPKLGISRLFDGDYLFLSRNPFPKLRHPWDPTVFKGKLHKSTIVDGDSMSQSTNIEHQIQIRSNFYVTNVKQNGNGLLAQSPPSVVR